MGWRIKWRRIRHPPSFLRLGGAVGVGAAANGVVMGAQRSVHGAEWAADTTDQRARRCFFGLRVEEKINAKDES